MGVSKNRGTPKSSILIGFSIINHPFWGSIIFGNTHMFSRLEEYANHLVRIKLTLVDSTTHLRPQLLRWLSWICLFQLLERSSKLYNVSKIHIDSNAVPVVASSVLTILQNCFCNVKRTRKPQSSLTIRRHILTPFTPMILIYSTLCKMTFILPNKIPDQP